MLHVALIMDGNGRWARSRGLPRVAGHGQGARAVRRVVEAAPGLDVSTLTLFAFSSDNWARPRSEVTALMELFERYLERECGDCVRNGVRVGVIGRRDRLPRRLIRAIESTERATVDGRRLELRLAVDYSARQAILDAARRAGPGRALSLRRFGRLLNRVIHSAPESPPVDLVVRTGGEQRLSDFLLWECAYAELYFTDRMWPDFHGRDLARAVEAFCRRQRRFGRLPDEQDRPGIRTA